ncbi:hypothetical protein J2129_001306 [Methanofollis sp. W23]|uniref:hypothetical protein n=1 Tax=Methanofollis sp. W23 TaxID=2817849 RepID=UPI001AE618A1|nr:hypothetical protein [Methanofollis sp. W23]MBP2145852.1 hypothetical protein [Methanofollis sp. W23]
MPTLEIDFSDHEFNVIEQYYASAVESRYMSLEDYLRKAVVTMAVQILDDFPSAREENPDVEFSTSLSERECDEFGLSREFYT